MMKKYFLKFIEKRKNKSNKPWAIYEFSDDPEKGFEVATYYNTAFVNHLREIGFTGTDYEVVESFFIKEKEIGE